MKKYLRKPIFFLFFIPIYFLSFENPNTHPLSDDFADLVGKLSPSVVNVFTVQKPKKTSDNQMPFDNIPPQFRDFFKNFPPGFLLDLNQVPSNNHKKKDPKPWVQVLLLTPLDT